MEVSLLNIRGLPPGCVISVRAGTTRRQAPADPDKLRLVFPKGLSKNDPFKVDLLAPLGSADLKVQPGANAYPVQVPVNGTIGTITLGVRETPPPPVVNKQPKLDLNNIASMDYTKDEKGRPTTPATASRRHLLALEARTYLDDHQLLVFVQNLLQSLIRDRPNDPWEYINQCSNNAKKSGVTEKLAPLNEVVPPSFAPAPRSGPNSEAKGAALEAAAEAAGAGAGAVAGEATPVAASPRSTAAGVEESPLPRFHLRPSVGTWLSKPSRPLDGSPAAVEQLCAKMHDTLVTAANDGRLRTAISELYPNDEDGEETLAETKAMAAAALRDAAESGTLHGMLARTLGAGPAKAPEPLSALPELQAKARNALLDASESGRLMGIVGHAHAVSPKKDAKARKEDAKTEVDQLRESACDMLLKAGQNGSLLEALRAVSPPSKEVKDAEELRGLACSMLTKAGQNGTLLEALRTASPSKEGRPTEIEELRGRACAMLSKASKDGSLLEALRASTPPAASAAAEAEELRGLACGMLLRAGENGTLLEALRAASPGAVAAPEHPSTPALKEEAKQALELVDKDDRFLGALQEAAKEAGFELTLKRKDAKEEETHDIDSLRATMREQLVGSCADGSFGSALKESCGHDAPGVPSHAGAKADDVEPLRTQAREKLLGAAGDGTIRQIVTEAADAEAEHDFLEGDEAIERHTSQRGTVRRRTKTEVLLKLEDGNEMWKPAKGLDKVPRLNLAPAIQLMKRDLALQELYAPVWDVKCGDEVINQNDKVRGAVVERTTTHCLMKTDDGQESWNPNENLQQVLSFGTDVTEGEEVVDARQGRRGSVRQRTTTDILVLHDDGTEDWYEIEEVGRAKSRMPTKQVSFAAATPMLPFGGYYNANFKGPSIVEGIARKLFAKPIQRPAPPPAPKSAPTTVSSMAKSCSSFPELEEKVRERNERFKLENEALRRENLRLKALHDSKVEGERLASENSQLRRDLGNAKKGQGPNAD